MLHDIAAGIRPETAANDGFFSFLLGSFSGGALLALGFMLVDLLKDFWSPAKEKSAVTYSSSYPDRDESETDKSDHTSKLLMGIGIAWLLGLFG